jgi:hypothetical protein
MQLRDAITATVINPASLCADAQRRGLQRIAATLDAVPYLTMCNLANLAAALRGLLDLIEVHLMCVGAGPTLDHADAAAFLAGFEPMIDVEHRGRDLYRGRAAGCQPLRCERALRQRRLEN